jgi:hypothetical protein
LATISAWFNAKIVQPLTYIIMGNVEMDEWYDRYDEAHVEVQAARTAHTAALLSVGEAELAVRRAEEKLQAIFREKVDLSEPPFNFIPHEIIK